MDGFRDKVAVVTGGASGIGRALCEQLGRHGAILVVADIDAEKAEAVAQGIGNGGGRARSAALDVTQAEAVRQLIDATVAAHGRIDYLFNNAGIAIVGDAIHMTAADWERIIAVNLRGVVNGVAAAYPRMIAQRGGHIVNTASMAGLLPMPALAAYAMTKHAVLGLSASLRIEAAPLGVRVSAVCPGFVNTGIVEAAQYLDAPREAVAPVLRFLRPIEASDCARAALRGVSRNRAIIVIPFAARLGWWFYRVFPQLWLPAARWAMGRYRELPGAS